MGRHIHIHLKRDGTAHAHDVGPRAPTAPKAPQAPKAPTAGPAPTATPAHPPSMPKAPAVPKPTFGAATGGLKATTTGLGGAATGANILTRGIRRVTSGMGDAGQSTGGPKSQQQRKAMWAAASGKGNIGIPKSVGQEFAEKDPGGKLPATTGDLKPGEMTALQRLMQKFYAEEAREPEHQGDTRMRTLGSRDYGTSEGAKKAAQTRGKGGAPNVPTKAFGTRPVTKKTPAAIKQPRLSREERSSMGSREQDYRQRMREEQRALRRKYGTG